MATAHQDLITRLSRIEGQVAALKRSLAQETPDCTQTLTQAKAAARGLKQFAHAFARAHARQCLSQKGTPAHFVHELDDIISSAFTLS